MSAGVLALFFLLAAAEPPRSPAAAGAPAAGKPASAKRGRTAEDVARDHYKTGVSLLDAGNISQALIHFKIAHETAPSPANLAMMGHCEYHLGSFKEARQHYEEYLRHESTGQQAETARQRIQAMDRRQAVLAIETFPKDVNVVLERLDGNGEKKTGQAPNRFPVSAGRWRVTVSKEGYRSESQEEVVESTDTKPLFFNLERQPGRLEIVTSPPGATLYVRGNRARNPFVQDVDPGAYELYAEAPHFVSEPQTYIVAPGETRKITFRLNYVQRSGRPELIGFWSAAGAMAGGMAVLARVRRTTGEGSGASELTAGATVVAGGALVGGLVGALTANAVAPNYIRDNLALFRIGAAWIGAAEGASIGLAFDWSYTSALIGGGLGLTAGALTGKLLDYKAPNYGRVATIQSAAAIGLMAGALAVPALDLENSEHSPAFLLGGLNVGLATGLALAYMPDQREYGPRWQQVMLINLGTGAGVIGGAMVDIVRQCLDPLGVRGNECSIDTPNRQPTAQYALIGGALGLTASWILTSALDTSDDPPPERTPFSSVMTLPSVLPVPGADGSTRPGLGVTSVGRF